MHTSRHRDVGAHDAADEVVSMPGLRRRRQAGPFLVCMCQLNLFINQRMGASGDVRGHRLHGRVRDSSLAWQRQRASAVHARDWAMCLGVALHGTGAHGH